MLKYCESAITFLEAPDEISLALSISNCPCHCDGCSEKHLWNDIGVELTDKKINELIDKNPGITTILLLGGDADHADVVRIARTIHLRNLKVGMYSGLDSLDPDLLECLDFYKIGRWIPFHGPEETWKDQTAGPLCLPTSNQIYLEKHDGMWINETQKFRRKIINDWKRVIIK